MGIMRDPMRTASEVSLEHEVERLHNRVAEVTAERNRLRTKLDELKAHVVAREMARVGRAEQAYRAAQAFDVD